MKKDICIVGIAGGSASGKTTIVNNIKELFQNDDHPNAFDTDLMLQHLRQLKKGEPINCPIYDYTVHNRSRNFQVIYPTNVIFVEGILIFENKELC